MVSAVHGVRQSLPIQVSLLWSLRGSAGLHAGYGIWLFRRPPESRFFFHRMVLRLFNSLGVVVNWEQSRLLSHQKTFYLGVLLDSVSFRACPAQKRFKKLLSIGSLFLSCVDQPANLG